MFWPIVRIFVFRVRVNDKSPQLFILFHIEVSANWKKFKSIDFNSENSQVEDLPVARRFPQPPRLTGFQHHLSRSRLNELLASR